MPISLTKEEIRELDKQFRGDKKSMELSDKDKLLYYLAKITSGYTGADLESVAREAAMLALRESIESKQVKKEHFEEALTKIKPSVSKNTIEIYKKMEDDYLKSAKAAIPASTYLG